MLNYTGNCPNWLLPVSDGNIKLCPLLLQPPARGRNSGFFCCQVSPYSMSKNIPCGNTPTSRPTGPDHCGTFCSTLIPPGVPFCTPSLQALAARVLLDSLWGWPPPRSPYPRLYRCSVLKNATRPDIRKIVTGHKHSRQQNPLRKTHGNALVQTSATRGHHHPHTPGRRD